MRPVRFISLMAFVIAPSVQPAPAHAQQVASEAYFGVVGRPCEVPDLKANLGPAATSSSPPIASDAKLVDDYIKAAERGDRRALKKLSTPEWLSSPVNASCLSAIKTLRKQCRDLTPYLLGDLEIRVAWACENRLVYRIFLTISDNKVANIWSATRPPAVYLPPQDPLRKSHPVPDK